MKTKFLICIFLILLLTTCSILPVFAHSGRTDANGGHYDEEAEEYHYHHGYPAHYHTNGKCPYDYDDKTNHNSGGSSSNSNSSSSKEEPPDIFGFIMTALGFGLLFFCIAVFVCSKTKSDSASKAWAIIFFIIWIIVSLIIGIRDYL